MAFVLQKASSVAFVSGLETSGRARLLRSTAAALNGSVSLDETAMAAGRVTEEAAVAQAHGCGTNFGQPLLAVPAFGERGIGNTQAATRVSRLMLWS
jgi:hypothetical protein